MEEAATGVESPHPDEKMRYLDDEDAIAGLRMTEAIFGLGDDGVDGPLWHYSHLESGQSILRDGHFWATDGDYMNDNTELRMFKRALVVGSSRRLEEEGSELRKRIANICFFQAQTIHTCYVISFTRLEDDLSQWRAYGDDGRGSALVFDGATLRGEAAKQQGAGSGWLQVECKYLPTVELDALAERLLEEMESAYEQERPDLAAAMLIFSLQWAGPVLKNSSFEREQEVRLVAFGQHRLPGKGDAAPQPNRKTRLRGSLNIPYVELAFEQSAEGFCLGPKHQEDVERAGYGARSFLSSISRGDVKLDFSAHPYTDVPPRGHQTYPLM